MPVLIMPLVPGIFDSQNLFFFYVDVAWWWKYFVFPSPLLLQLTINLWFHTLVSHDIQLFLIIP